MGTGRYFNGSQDQLTKVTTFQVSLTSRPAVMQIYKGKDSTDSHNNIRTLVMLKFTATSVYWQGHTLLLRDNVHSVRLSKQKDSFSIQRTVMKDMSENARNCKRYEQSSMNEFLISETGSNGTMFANFS